MNDKTVIIEGEAKQRVSRKVCHKKHEKVSRF